MPFRIIGSRCHYGSNLSARAYLGDLANHVAGLASSSQRGSRREAAHDAVITGPLRF